jgi:hypothetical protein
MSTYLSTPYGADSLSMVADEIRGGDLTPGQLQHHSLDGKHVPPATASLLPALGFKATEVRVMDHDAKSHWDGGPAFPTSAQLSTINISSMINPRTPGKPYP